MHACSWPFGLFEDGTGVNGGSVAAAPGNRDQQGSLREAGRQFFDYCNATWPQTHPIPASGCIGGIYDMDAAMEQNVRQLKASVPDLTHYFDLMDHMHEQPEKSQAILCASASNFCKSSKKFDNLDV